VARVNCHYAGRQQLGCGAATKYDLGDIGLHV